jgi:hypothetical protein
LTDVVVHPAPVQQPIPVWLAVGGSRSSPGPGDRGGTSGPLRPGHRPLPEGAP